METLLLGVLAAVKGLVVGGVVTKILMWLFKVYYDWYVEKTATEDDLEDLEELEN